MQGFSDDAEGDLLPGQVEPPSQGCAFPRTPLRWAGLPRALGPLSSAGPRPFQPTPACQRRGRPSTVPGRAPLLGVCLRAWRDAQAPPPLRSSTRPKAPRAAEGGGAQCIGSGDSQLSRAPFKGGSRGGVGGCLSSPPPPPLSGAEFVDWPKKTGGLNRLAPNAPERNVNWPKAPRKM